MEVRAWLPLVCVLALAAFQNATVRVVLLYLPAHLLYVVYVGGDFMPGHRFLVPDLPLMGLLMGAAVAAQQSWPRHLPLDFAALGVNVESAVRSLPLADVLPRFFVGPADCGSARWSIAGLAASEWALLAFVLFIVAAYLAARRE